MAAQPFQDASKHIARKEGKGRRPLTLKGETQHTKYSNNHYHTTPSRVLQSRVLCTKLVGCLGNQLRTRGTRELGEVFSLPFFSLEDEPPKVSFLSSLVGLTDMLKMSGHVRRTFTDLLRGYGATCSWHLDLLHEEHWHPRVLLGMHKTHGGEVEAC
jgi:hypothetical protein